MEIRFAQTWDVPGVLELLRQEGQLLHRSQPDYFRSNAQKYGPSQIIAMLNNSNTPVFVAVEERKVLGCCLCRINTFFRDPVIVDHTDCCIDSLCVDESFRRKGIGTVLYQTVCRYAKQRSCRSVTLHVPSCNEGAMKFYASLGLKPQQVGMEAPLTDE